MAEPLPFSIARRHVILAGAGLLVGKGRACAATEPAVGVERVIAAGSPVETKRYRSVGMGRRPTVLILPGSKGLAPHRDAYDRYARALAAVDVDAVLFDDMRPDEVTAIGAAPSASERRMLYARSVDRWASVVRAVAAASRQDGRGSGRIGLLSFSLGGFLAVAAASEPMFSVLTVFYAGLPTFYDHAITVLPPLLDIHGDSDRAVPLAQGAALVSAAKRLGGVAELAVFRGAGHGFDLDHADRTAAAAMKRGVAFTARWLHQG